MCFMRLTISSNTEDLEAKTLRDQRIKENPKRTIRGRKEHQKMQLDLKRSNKDHGRGLWYMTEGPRGVTAGQVMHA